MYLRRRNDLNVGDKATQMEESKKLGKEVLELDIYGNLVE